MPDVVHYRDLAAWQKAMGLAAECYQATHEHMGAAPDTLAEMIREAAVALPTRIAVANERETIPAYIDGVRDAQGGLAALDTYLSLAQQVRLLPDDTCADLQCRSDEVAKLLRALIRALKQKAQA